jgi:hypothetical protein
MNARAVESYSLAFCIPAVVDTAKVENPWFYLSVSPDGRSILYSQNDQADNDVMFVQLFQ